MRPPSIYQLKPPFQNLLRPIVRRLAAVGITPNQVTITAITLSFLTGIALLFWSQYSWIYFWIPIALLLRMGLNAIDGMLAREHQMQTRLGGILNELGDVISDTAIYLPFALIPGISAALIVPVVILAILTEMAGILAVTTGDKRRYDGPMGKSDRALIFAVVSLCLGLGIRTGTWLDTVWMILICLLILTIFNRIKGAIQSCK